MAHAESQYKKINRVTIISDAATDDVSIGWLSPKTNEKNFGIKAGKSRKCTRIELTRSRWVLSPGNFLQKRLSTADASVILVTSVKFPVYLNTSFVKTWK
jgi:hypothetical protein